MPAVPKKKSPKSRQGKRRSHLSKAVTALVTCPHCHAPRPTHRVCPSCGYYKGREAVVAKKPELPTTPA